MTAIWGSRQKAKLALKRTTPTPKRDNSPVAVTTAVKSNEETVDTKPDASLGGKVQTESKPPIARLDLILFLIKRLGIKFSSFYDLQLQENLCWFYFLVVLELKLDSAGLFYLGEYYSYIN